MIPTRRAGNAGRRADRLGHWQQFASYVGLFFGPICTTFSTVFFAGSNFWFRVSFMSNKIQALGATQSSFAQQQRTVANKKKTLPALL